jgi:hypothetical protein
MPTVFFSWQTDTSGREGRSLIERALERATSRINKDTSVEGAERELSVDRDTKGVGGSPPIVDTIFRKIDQAAVFVPDLTFIGKRPDGRPTPNPNVLIEYGWALKSIGTGRIVPVMNTAFGEPSDQMPFDMRHLRNPMSYHCAEGASAEDLAKARDTLSRQLEAAIRVVLDGEDYKSSIPRAPLPKPFEPRNPVGGPGRFKPAGEAIGFLNVRMPGSQPFPEIRLSPDPAMWLRVMPAHDPGRTWKVDELERLMFTPFVRPLGGTWNGYDSFRTHEGFGIFAATPDRGRTRALVFAFVTGEIWSTDTFTLWAYKDRPGNGTVPKETVEFCRALREYGKLLVNLGVAAPFRWIAGMEDLRDRLLYGSAGGPVGQCQTDVIIKEGLYSPGEDEATALRPLFEEMFNACGVSLPDTYGREAG